MESIKGSPLPPLGGGPPTKLSPADRADLVNRAREVIDDYMFGTRSWQTDGPRKSARQTIEDLERFKSEIAVRRQFVEDPDSIITSIEHMIDAAIKQINDADSLEDGDERMNKAPVPPSDPIELSSLRSSPQKIQIMMPQMEDRSASLPEEASLYHRTGAEASTDSDAGLPSRYLRGRLVDKSGRTVFESGAPPVPFVRSGPLAPQALDPNQPPGPSSSGPAFPGAYYGGNNVRLSGGNGSGQALPAYPIPSIFGGADASALSGADMSDWFTRWVKPLMQN
jgi:hypothetical protein